MSDFNLDIGDIPEIPEEAVNDLNKDTFDYPIGFNFAFVGVGQAGGRIVKTFRDIGYRKTCAINTASSDLAELTEFPEYNKLVLGNKKGAGKDPTLAADMVKDKDQEIYDLYTKSLGSDIDYVFICLSGAGGTGAGTYSKAADVAKKYMRDNKKPNRVGCIMALPKDSEGQKSAKNVLYSIKELTRLNLSPIIFIDNEKFKDLYGNSVSARQEKPASNSSTAKLLHTFNQLAGTDSEDVGGTTFDPTDFSKILDSGVVAFAAASTKKWAEPTDISTPIREKLQRNVLASVDLSKGTCAGLLYVISGEAWDGPNAVPVNNLDYGNQQMSRILADGSAVFTGVYPSGNDQNSINILAMIGGLPFPQDRLTELANISGIAKNGIAEFLGV